MLRTLPLCVLKYEAGSKITAFFLEEMSVGEVAVPLTVHHFPPEVDKRTGCFMYQEEKLHSILRNEA